MSEGKKKVRLDSKTAKEMKQAGLPLPPDVNTSSFNQPEHYTPKHQTIAYLAAIGHSGTKIAEVVGMSDAQISVLLNSDRMQFEIKRVTYKMFGKDPQKRFREILPHAIDAAEQVMMDPNAKAAIKLSAAQDFIDRALGKPKQTVEVEGSLIRDMLERLDQKQKKDSPRIIDVESDVPQLEAGPVKEIEPEPKPLDEAAEWVKNNL